MVKIVPGGEDDEGLTYNYNLHLKKLISLIVDIFIQLLLLSVLRKVHYGKYYVKKNLEDVFSNASPSYYF